MRYTARLYGFLGIVVVCLPSARLYVTNVLWLTGIGHKRKLLQE